MTDTKKYTCSCPPGKRSTHCDLHGICLCAHGTSCPGHDEPEKLLPVEYVVSSRWLRDPFFSKNLDVALEKAKDELTKPGCKQVTIELYGG